MQNEEQLTLEDTYNIHDADLNTVTASTKTNGWKMELGFSTTVDDCGPLTEMDAFQIDDTVAVSGALHMWEISDVHTHVTYNVDGTSVAIDVTMTFYNAEHIGWKE